MVTDRAREWRGQHLREGLTTLRFHTRRQSTFQTRRATKDRSHTARPRAAAPPGPESPEGRRAQRAGPSAARRPASRRRGPGPGSPRSHRPHFTLGPRAAAETRTSAHRDGTGDGTGLAARSDLPSPQRSRRRRRRGPRRPLTLGRRGRCERRSPGLLPPAAPRQEGPRQQEGDAEHQAGDHGHPAARRVRHGDPPPSRSRYRPLSAPVGSAQARAARACAVSRRGWAGTWGGGRAGAWGRRAVGAPAPAPALALCAGKVLRSGLWDARFPAGVGSLWKRPWASKTQARAGGGIWIPSFLSRHKCFPDLVSPRPPPPLDCCTANFLGGKKKKLHRAFFSPLWRVSAVSRLVSAGGSDGRTEQVGPGRWKLGSALPRCEPISVAAARLPVLSLAWEGARALPAEGLRWRGQPDLQGQESVSVKRAGRGHGSPGFSMKNCFPPLSTWDRCREVQTVFKINSICRNYLRNFKVINVRFRKRARHLHIVNAFVLLLRKVILKPPSYYTNNKRSK